MRARSGRLLCVAVLIVGSLTITTHADADSDGGTWPTAVEAVADLGPGVNLGNGFEAPVPGTWGVDVTPELLDAVVAAGFEAVRFPVRFNAHAEVVSPYTLDPAFMTDVDEIVDAATDRGLTIVVDLHHYDELHNAPAVHRDRFLAIWSQVAERYADRSSNVWFELLNEPHPPMNASTWNALAADALAVVRSTNPQRIVLVGATFWSWSLALVDLEIPADPYAVATFHSYDPFPFTHQGADWVAGSDAWLGTRWSGTQSEIDAVHDVVSLADAYTQATGVPVVLGEYGAYRTADHGDRILWTDAVGCVADSYGIPTFYWEFAAGFGVYDVPSTTFDAGLLEAVVPPRERSCRASWQPVPEPSPSTNPEPPTSNPDPPFSDPGASAALADSSVAPLPDRSYPQVAPAFTG